MNNLTTVCGVSGYIDENGTAQLNLENCARGLGFTQISASGNEVIRWERVSKYLEELGFIPTSGDGGFIPENIFYRLAMKASNKTAIDFQCKIANEILPSIRKHGMYATDQTIENILTDPEFGIRLLTELKTERNRSHQLEIENAQSKQIIGELQPKASYYDLILQSDSLVPITKIAKDYGMSGKAMNALLHDEFGIQYRMGGTWLLYQKYAEMGYTQSKTHVIDAARSEMHMYWTQKGRLFLYYVLKNKLGILPLVERQEESA